MATGLDDVALVTDPRLQTLLGAFLFLMMLSVALNLRLDDFRSLARRPLVPVVGWLAQFLLLPAATFALTILLDPRPSIALGMMVVAACPGGNLSNFLSLLAKGNLALSVTLTAFSSLAAMVLMPANILFWAGLNPATAGLLQEIGIDPVSFLVQIALTLFAPLVLGIVVGHYAPGFAQKARVVVARVSLIGLGVFGVVLTVNYWSDMVGFLPLVLPMVVAQNAVALGLGYGAGLAFGRDRADRRAMTFEIGIQNSGLGLVVVLAHLQGLGGAALVAGVWGIWHIVSGGTLALIWSRTRGTAGEPADPRPAYTAVR